MGMSTLAVKPRGRVQQRANAHAGGCAGRKAPALHRSFLEQNKCLVARRRDYGSGEGRRCSVTPLTISDARPSRARMNRRAAGVAGKSHFEDFHLDRWHKSQFHRPWRQQFRRGARSGAGLSGDWAMWIIWYVAMVASLRAMGLATSSVAVRTDADRQDRKCVV